MLKVMERLSDFNIGHCNARSLANLKAGTKKRKRADLSREFKLVSQVQLKDQHRKDSAFHSNQVVKRTLMN
jgi:hypothetical protein